MLAVRVSDSASIKDTQVDTTYMRQTSGDMSALCRTTTCRYTVSLATCRRLGNGNHGDM